MTNSEFLDSISAPSSSRARMKKANAKRGADELIEISDSSEEEDGEQPRVS